jgi:hypothetical protein
MPLIIPANTLSGVYEVSNSVRFRPAGNSQMSQGNGTQTNSKKWTISFWVKIAFDTSSSGQRCVYSSTGASSNGSFVQFSDTAMKIGCQGVSETDWVRFLGTATIQFRDSSAWYHFCFGFDSTQSTDTNRIRSYVNGTEVGYLASEGNYPTQNDDSNFNNGSDCALGKNITTNDSYLDGYVSQFYFIDGTQYAASDFGETDEDSGIWKPKAFSGTFGNNGTFVEGDSNTADASGNGNNFGQSNTVITTDTPTNNFCTFNPLDNAVLTLSEGNTKATHSTSSGGEENRGTMGFANGKWYWEFQIGYDVPTSRLQPFGVGLLTNTGRNPLESDLKTTEAYTVHWYTDTSNNLVIEKVFNSGTNVTASESYPDNGDIVQFAIDADAGKVWVGKNNTYLDDASGNVGDPANGNYPIHTYTVVEGNFIFPAIVNVGSQGLTILLNTGNPSFAISSGNADANGYGNFEHAPPSGFYSICSKNLAEFG